LPESGQDKIIANERHASGWEVSTPWTTILWAVRYARLLSAPRHYRCLEWRGLQTCRFRIQVVEGGPDPMLDEPRRRLDEALLIQPHSCPCSPRRVRRLAGGVVLAWKSCEWPPQSVSPRGMLDARTLHCAQDARPARGDPQWPNGL